MSLATFRVAHDIPRLVLLGPLPVRASDLLSGHEDFKSFFPVVHLTSDLQFSMDNLIDLRARLIVRRHDQCSFRLHCIRFGDFLEPLVRIYDFVNAPLIVQLFHCFPNLATREVLYNFFERGVFLPHDFIKACGLNSGLLELLIRSARFHSLVLANVAHQQDTVIFPETVKKLVDLLRAGKTGLVENIESLLAIVWVVACQIPLQRGGLNADSASFCTERDVGTASPSTL